MNITASQVKELRELTGIGMMHCKKALVESEGNIEKAIENLRKQGEDLSNKRAGKDANEGCVFIGSSLDKTAIVEINCETDFVAKCAIFQDFGKAIVDLLLEGDFNDVNELLGVGIDEEENIETLGDAIKRMSGMLGEKIEIKHFETEVIGEFNIVGTYSHMGGKIGVIINLTYSGYHADKTVLEGIAKKLCMQVAATKPIAVHSHNVSETVLNKEREIYKELALKAGTKEEYIDRQIEGKLKKYLKEVCLSEQNYIKDNKTSVAKLLTKTEVAMGIVDLEIDSFVRFELGN
jgi:elongation factor Ts